MRRKSHVERARGAGYSIEILNNESSTCTEYVGLKNIHFGIG